MRCGDGGAARAGAVSAARSPAGRARPDRPREWRAEQAWPGRWAGFAVGVVEASAGGFAATDRSCDLRVKRLRGSGGVVEQEVRRWR